MEITDIAAMAIAAIAEETHQSVNNMKIISFSEVQKSGLEEYIEKNNILYKKYELGDEINEQV